MRMSLWLIGIAIVAVLAAIAVFWRRSRVPAHLAADSAGPGAALRAASTAPSEAAPAEVSIPAPPAVDGEPGGVTPTEALNVRAETMRALRELALDTTLSSTALALPPDELSARV